MVTNLESITGQELFTDSFNHGYRPTNVYSVKPGRGGRLSPFFKMDPYDAMDRMAQSPDKLRAVFYIDEERLQAPRDSTRYMGLSMASNPGTQVYFVTDPDESLAEHSDLVVPRMDPPLDYDFSRALDEYDDGKRTFVNPPKTQRYLANKRYLKDLIPLGVLPETLISRDLGELVDFSKNLGDDYVIVKPVVGFGGDDVEKVYVPDENSLDGFGFVRGFYPSSEALDILGGGDFKIGKLEKSELEKALYEATNRGRRSVVCQRYLSNVGEVGDKRVFLLDGEPIGSILRLPQDGSYLCNTKKGGSTIRSHLTDENYDTIERIQPLIKDRDMHFVGIDLIGRYVMEINGVSPGLIYGIDESTKNLYSPDGVAGTLTEWAFKQKTS